MICLGDNDKPKYEALLGSASDNVQMQNRFWKTFVSLSQNYPTEFLDLPTLYAIHGLLKA